MRTRVYISGPISKGNREANIKQAVDAAWALMSSGFAVLCPHLSCYFPWADDVEHGEWIANDLPWVAASDAVVLLPGESKGAEEECDYARKLGIPVYEGVEALLNDPPIRGDARFHEVLRQAGALHDRKQKDYGRKGDPFANVRSSAEWGIPPWLGALLRANDKVSRLKTFATCGTLANEGVEDSMLDGAVYFLIALVLFREAMEQKAAREDAEWSELSAASRDSPDDDWVIATSISASISNI